MNYEQFLKATKKRNAKMLELKIKGLTYKQIAAKYGITRQRAEQIIHRERKLDKAGKRSIME